MLQPVSLGYKGPSQRRKQSKLTSQAVCEAMDDEDHTEDAPGRGRQVRGPHSHLFLFSSSAMSCLCCLLASKLKLASAGGRVYGGEKLFVFFPPKFKYPESETVNFLKKKSFFEVLFAYHKTHPTQQSYHI